MNLNTMTLTIGYDVENLMDSKRQKSYQGEVTTDHYGRKSTQTCSWYHSMPPWSVWSGSRRFICD